MKTLLTVALVLCLGALVSVQATPAEFRNEEFPYFIKYLEIPDDSVTRTIRNVIHQKAVMEVSAEGRNIPTNQGRILFGEEAAENQFPYQVALIADTPEGQYFCGGSFITQRWVLTAAHCIPENVTWIQVRACSNQWRTAPVQPYVTRAIWHGNFSTSGYQNSVALLDLGEELNLDCVQLVELETDGCEGDTLDWQPAVASGWGIAESGGKVVDDLRFVDTLTSKNSNCTLYYTYGIVIDSTICTISPVGLDGVLCNGDMGGPLVWSQTGRQIGIDSYVSARGCYASVPSGHTRVPCFIDWIEYIKTI